MEIFQNKTEIVTISIFLALAFCPVFDTIYLYNICYKQVCSEKAVFCYSHRFEEDILKITGKSLLQQHPVQ